MDSPRGVGSIACFAVDKSEIFHIEDENLDSANLNSTSYPSHPPSSPPSPPPFSPLSTLHSPPLPLLSLLFLLLRTSSSCLFPSSFPSHFLLSGVVYGSSSKSCPVFSSILYHSPPFSGILLLSFSPSPSPLSRHHFLPR